MSIAELWPIFVLIAMSLFASSFGIVTGLYNVFDRDRRECKERISELEQQVAFLMRLYSPRDANATQPLPPVNISFRAGDDSIGSVGGNMERQ